MLEAFEELEASPRFQQELDFPQLRHGVVIAVNSRSAPSTDWDRQSTSPGFVSQLLQSSSVPIDHYSYESVELLKDVAQRWSSRRNLMIAQRQLEGLSKKEAEARSRRSASMPSTSTLMQSPTPSSGATS